MDEVLRLLNELVAEGVIGQYAIGGAIGATFYIEAFNTEDVDVFVILGPAAGSLLISLEPIYAAAKAKGAIERQEHLVIGSWPVQILPAYKPLVEEALENALAVNYFDVPTRVFGAEYLCAIALDTGRPKDFFRVSAFIEQEAVDIPLLKVLVSKYGLIGKTAQVPNWPQ